MHFGIQPVFVDVDENGNMSSEALQRKITSRTKAVMLTHIWGIPCKMSEILSVLSKYPHVLLLEDCSHAHGASINGKCVGTFGDGAAWSLQGQKINTRPCQSTYETCGCNSSMQSGIKQFKNTYILIALSSAS
jgi:perosamine synthetase